VREWDRYLHRCEKRGISLNQYFGWVGLETHRQFLLWEDWYSRQWNEPSLTDHYLMQLTMVVRQLLAKNPRRIKMKDQKLKFGTGTSSRPALSKEEATRRSKSVWLGIFTRMGTKVRTLMPDGTYEYLSARENILGILPKREEGEESAGEMVEERDEGLSFPSERDREERSRGDRKRRDPLRRSEALRERSVEEERADRLWERERIGAEEDLPYDPSWDGKSVGKQRQDEEEPRTMYSPRRKSGE
jgi:hypothetical protein